MHLVCYFSGFGLISVHFSHIHQGYIAFGGLLQCQWDNAEANVGKYIFTHDQPSISPWIKSISNELDITCHVLSSQLSGYCDVIANQLWRHQQNVKRASETWGWCVKILVFSAIYGFVCRVRNKIMYVLLWRTVYALTRVLFWCFFSAIYGFVCRVRNKIMYVLLWRTVYALTRVLFWCL